MIKDEGGLLGPSPRIVMWLHGCHRSCKGCIARGFNSSPAQYSLSVGTLAQMINDDGELEGITVSGGEPFLQAEALYELINSINVGVIVYTGYTREELEQMGSEAVNGILGKIDVLVDGEYVEELNDDAPHRGSSNQRIHQLSDRYRDYYSAPAERKTRIESDGGYMYMYGIPDRDQRDRWLAIKESALGDKNGR